MNLAVIYLVLGVISAVCTLTAVVQARRLWFFSPLYFMTAWLAGELAPIHLLWQIGLTAGLAMTGVLAEPAAQYGLAAFGLSWLGLVFLHVQAMDSPRHLWAGLKEALGEDFRAGIPAPRQGLLQQGIITRHWLRPFSFPRPGVELLRGISYGEAGLRNELDIHRPKESREGGFPVLLQVHGGAWIIGEKEQQAKPLMYHLAQRGWICVAINYRLSPKAAFPDHIIDVKKAIHWIREHIAEYGGNPDFIAITGGSAGGHLSSLAALTPNLQAYQPGFEQVDTSVQAAVPFYGVYDFMDREGIRGGMSMEGFLEDKVMQVAREDNRELWDTASPVTHVGPHAPPMFVIQGTHDSLVWVEEARSFVAALRSVAENPVAYAELPGAQHAFEIFHSVRTDHTVNAVTEFLEWSHARWCREQASEAGDESPVVVETPGALPA